MHDSLMIMSEVFHTLMITYLFVPIVLRDMHVSPMLGLGHKVKGNLCKHPVTEDGEFLINYFSE